jgi:cytochrome c oxidase cbb3-type subunit IV
LISSNTTTKPIFAEETIVSSTYTFFAHFAQTWGLVYFVVIFVLVLAYALWPSRQKQFEESARIPLRED